MTISFVLPFVWCPHSNKRYQVFVFQRVTQAENLYSAKLIEIHQLRLV